jgi:hypothetical protein
MHKSVRVGLPLLTFKAAVIYIIPLDLPFDVSIGVCVSD